MNIWNNELFVFINFYPATILGLRTSTNYCYKRQHFPHFPLSHWHLPSLPTQYITASKIRHVYMGQMLINHLLGPGMYIVKITNPLSEPRTLAPVIESLGTDLSEALDGSQISTLPLRGWGFSSLYMQSLSRIWAIPLGFIFLSLFLKRTSVLHSSNTTDWPLSGQQVFRLWLPSGIGQQPSIHAVFLNFISVSKEPDHCCGSQQRNMESLFDASILYSFKLS